VGEQYGIECEREKVDGLVLSLYSLMKINKNAFAIEERRLLHVFARAGVLGLGSWLF